MQSLWPLFPSWEGLGVGYSCLLPLALVVRYGADYLNAGYKVEDEGKSAPNALLPLASCLLPLAYSLE